MCQQIQTIPLCIEPKTAQFPLQVYLIAVLLVLPSRPMRAMSHPTRRHEA